MAKGRHRSTEEESIVFPNTFIRDLPENPWAALNHVAHMIISYESTAVDTKSLPSQQIQARANTYESYLMAFRIAEAIIEANNMPIKVPKLDISNVHGNGKSISEFMATIADISYHRAVSFHSESEINSIKGQIMLKWKNAFAYEFSDGDLLRIQNLINELRSEIATTNKLDDKYKARLLRRLEKLQNEINKRIASLDSLWALVGEAGVVLGKLVQMPNR